MRVHFVNENVGGHATMHLHLRAALADRGDVEATFFDTPPPGLFRRVVAAQVPGLARLDLDLHPLREQLARSSAVRRHLDDVRPAPDVLHVYTHNAALLSVGHLRRTPSVVSLDSTNRQNAYRIPHRHPTRFTPLTVRATAPFERRVYAAARRIVTHSRWCADSVMTYGISADRIEVIPFGITLPPSRPPTDDGGPPRILFIGASMERKGGWRLLRLWREALSADSRLTLVTHEPVPSEPGLEVHNDIRPGDGRIAAVLAGAAILVMPGAIDAFGYAVLEAMTAGLPVVATRQAAIPELVTDGVSGLLAAPGDDAGLVAALRTLVLDATARTQLGSAGRAAVESRFDARLTTAALVDVLAAASAA